MWDLPGPGIEPVSPALQGRLLTSDPLGKLKVTRLVQTWLQFQTVNFKSLWLDSNTSLLVEIGTITINTCLPARNKFVYSCSAKIHSSGSWTLRKHFLLPLGCGSVFPAKSYQDAWRRRSWLARGLVKMADEAKLCSPIHSTFEALVVWHVRALSWRTGPFLLTNSSCRHYSFWCISSICWAYFSAVMV